MKIGIIFLLSLSLGLPQTVHVEVRLVNVTATVTDARGRYVHNLTRSDFLLEEDGVRQEIVHFDRDHDVPASVGILLDTSGSMAPRLAAATAAVDHFAQSMNRDDDIFLMTFSGTWKVQQGFTSDRGRISRALGSVRSMNSPTEPLDVVSAIYDSLNAALSKVGEGRHDKRIILIITDGRDTWSRTTLEQLTTLIQRSGVLVYSLGIGTPDGRNPVRRDVLQQFADSSGGRALQLPEGDKAELKKAVSKFAGEIHNQYIFSYYPSHPIDGRFHRIRLTVRSGFNIRTRNGYY